MRLLVFGAGAVGSFLGHRLVSAGHTVVLIGRDQHMAVVQRTGLLLDERRPAYGRQKHQPLAGTSTNAAQWSPSGLARPLAVTHIADLPANQLVFDLAILTVKVHDTATAAQTLAQYIAVDTPLLIVQNGIGGEEAALAARPQAQVISGVLTVAVSLVEPGHIRLETNRGGLSLAPVGSIAAVDPWAGLFAAAGLRTATFPNYRAMKWSKLLLNIQANALPAILDVSPGQVFADPALFAVERAAFLEAYSVMRALGLQAVRFPRYPVPLLVRAMQTLPEPLLRSLLRPLIASGRGDKKPSLQIALAERRERSEVSSLNGAVVEYASQLALNTPVNRVLVDTLQDIATGHVPWETFRGRPDALLGAIREARRPGLPSSASGR